MDKVLVISGDLANLARVKSACIPTGCDIALATRLPENAIPDPVKGVVVDLGWLREPPATVAELLRTHYPSARLIAFGPHVQEARLSAAEEAGFTVLTRGQLERGLASLLRKP
jgi:hypothetical protein